MSIGVALIGSGIFAKEEHLPAILACPHLTLKAVYSRSLASAASLTSCVTQKVDWYSDDTAPQGRGYDDLLTNTNIKAVIIALPILAQPKYIRKALAVGKHVLSEKPVAKDVESARELVEWYVSGEGRAKGTMWGVAENFRFLESFQYAAKEIKGLGKVLGVRVRVNMMVQPGSKYFETAWRKTPEYQGGFLLDGGVHFVAGIRVMLGVDDSITRVSAFTTQLQKHLPPVDTINAVIQTKSGISGTVNISFGTTFKGSGYAVACEKGVVTVVRSDVTVETEGVEDKKSFTHEANGVKQEIAAWAASITEGKPDPRQSPKEALVDLEVLEAMLKSGEKNGTPIDIGV